VLPTPCYVFSDVHLGHAPAEVERSLLSFLRHLRGHAASVVINGDLFEFWFEWKSVVPRHAVRVLAALADLRDAGVPVLMLGGNHDCWGGDVLRHDAGVDFRLDPWRGTIGGWRTHIEHGDGLRQVEDRRYRQLRRVLRNGLAIRAFRRLHPDLASRLALGSSSASRSYAPRDGGSGLQSVATALLGQERALDMVIYGHSHAAALARVSGGGVYANPGSWLEAPTFLRITPGRVALVPWTGSAEGADLDALDGPAQEPLP
jgi:UDP-2,3-diacylglucosamine hydrolase